MWNIAATPGLIAIGCLIPVSSWWFIQLSLLPQANGSTIANVSLLAIHAVLLLQLLTVSLFSPLWVTDAHDPSPRRLAFPRIGMSVVSAVLPAWPLLAMLSLASGLSASNLFTAEALVLATGFSVALIAGALQLLSVSAEITRLSQAFLGLVVATLAWVFRSDWFHWIGL